ncbi:MAG: metallophosphoesterase family protein [Chthoniobacteraceae bacterium]
MRIAVIADTHDRLPPRVLTAISSADEIWHLGDVCDPAIETSLLATGIPLRLVRGNCDSNTDWPLMLDFTLEGFRIRLIHIPPTAAPSGVDLLFHGHTHVPRHEVVGHATFYNPGCITRPNRGAPASYAWLELVAGEPPRWTLEPV